MFYGMLCGRMEATLGLREGGIIIKVYFLSMLGYLNINLKRCRFFTYCKNILNDNDLGLKKKFSIKLNII